MTKLEQIDSWAGQIHAIMLAYFLTTPEGMYEPDPGIAYTEAIKLWKARENCIDRGEL